MSKKFALIGAAGYIAPRHMEAIKATGNEIVAAFDPFDSVGILDRFFPDADFFTEFERFDRHLDKLRRKGEGVDFVSICSPNYLHDAHIRFGLRLGAKVICEKPVVLNPWTLTSLLEIQEETQLDVYNILQLRLHPSVIELKKKVEKSNEKNFDIELTYITSRGKWYHYSWKGNQNKSGGIATNIGVHFFDMLIWIFGEVKDSNIIAYKDDLAQGVLKLERANVRWKLSTDIEQVPQEVRDQGIRTYRTIKIGEDEFEFSGGFTELHTKSYQAILDGNGFKLQEAFPAIDLVHNIRNQGTR